MSDVDTDAPDPYDVVEQYWPYDGPHSRDKVHAAATAAGLLVRYMNNATWPHKKTLVYAQDADRLIGALAGTVGLLPQLVGQLRDFIGLQAQNPGVLYDDRAPNDSALAGRTGSILLGYLAEVLETLDVLHRQLERACSSSTRLGNHIDAHGNPIQ